MVFLPTCCMRRRHTVCPGRVKEMMIGAYRKQCQPPSQAALEAVEAVQLAATLMIASLLVAEGSCLNSAQLGRKDRSACLRFASSFVAVINQAIAAPYAGAARSGQPGGGRWQRRTHARHLLVRRVLAQSRADQ